MAPEVLARVGGAAKAPGASGATLEVVAGSSVLPPVWLVGSLVVAVKEVVAVLRAAARVAVAWVVAVVAVGVVAPVAAAKALGAWGVVAPVAAMRATATVVRAVVVVAMAEAMKVVEAMAVAAVAEAVKVVVAAEVMMVVPRVATVHERLRSRRSRCARCSMGTGCWRNADSAPAQCLMSAG